MLPVSWRTAGEGVEGIVHNPRSKGAMEEGMGKGCAGQEGVVVTRIEGARAPRAVPWRRVLRYQHGMQSA